MEAGKCRFCKYMDLYYVRGVTRFERTKLGWCSKKQCNVTTDSGCDMYAVKVVRKKSDIHIKRRLSDLLTEITAIRQIVEEENGGGEDL